MADSDRWRAWEARSDLEASGIASPDVRARVTTFLTAVFAAIDDLAATLPDATEDDLIAVLGPHVLYLPGPDEARTQSALIGLVVSRLLAALDGPNAEARLRAWQWAVTDALEGKAPPVRWATVAVFLRRVLRARLAGPDADDAEALDHAAAVLSAATAELLQDVGSQAIPPEAYHVM